jgi:hypothetical protein
MGLLLLLAAAATVVVLAMPKAAAAAPNLLTRYQETSTDLVAAGWYWRMDNGEPTEFPVGWHGPYATKAAALLAAKGTWVDAGAYDADDDWTLKAAVQICSPYALPATVDAEPVRVDLGNIADGIYRVTVVTELHGSMPSLDYFKAAQLGLAQSIKCGGVTVDGNTVRVFTVPAGALEKDRCQRETSIWQVEVVNGIATSAAKRVSRSIDACGLAKFDVRPFKRDDAGAILRATIGIDGGMLYATYQVSSVAMSVEDGPHGTELRDFFNKPAGDARQSMTLHASVARLMGRSGAPSRS